MAICFLKKVRLILCMFFLKVMLLWKKDVTCIIESIFFHDIHNLWTSPVVIIYCLTLSMTFIPDLHIVPDLQSYVMSHVMPCHIMLYIMLCMSYIMLCHNVSSYLTWHDVMWGDITQCNITWQYNVTWHKTYDRHITWHET